MSNQVPGSETEPTAQTTETVGGALPQAQTTETAESADERIARMEAALKKANNEAAKYRKAAEAAAQAEQERKDAELSETERLKKQLAEREQALKQLQTNELKRQAAAKFNLPEKLALRLQGETLEELEQDAENIAKELPKPAQARLGATNPGAAPGKKTDDEIYTEIWGGGKKIFDRAWNEQHGGGVFFNDKEG